MFTNNRSRIVRCFPFILSQGADPQAPPPNPPLYWHLIFVFVNQKTNFIFVDKIMIFLQIELNFAKLLKIKPIFWPHLMTIHDKSGHIKKNTNFYVQRNRTRYAEIWSKNKNIIIYITRALVIWLIPRPLKEIDLIIFSPELESFLSGYLERDCWY